MTSPGSTPARACRTESPPNSTTCARVASPACGRPVETTAAFETGRRVRDSEGAEGWVYHSLLSGRRTAVITMKTKDDLAPLYDRADPGSAVAALLQRA